MTTIKDRLSRLSPPPDEGLQGLLQEFEALRARFFNATSRYDRATDYTSQSVTMDQLDERLMVDCGFILREISRVCDDMRKEAEARMSHTSQLLGKAATIRATMASDPDLLKCEGSLANAMPSSKARPQIPKKGTEEYAQLMEFLGVPREAAESGVFGVHYKHYADWLTQRQQNGEPLPPGTRSPNPEFAMTYRAKRRKTSE